VQIVATILNFDFGNTS